MRTSGTTAPVRTHTQAPIIPLTQSRWMWQVIPPTVDASDHKALMSDAQWILKKFITGLQSSVCYTYRRVWAATLQCEIWPKVNFLVTIWTICLTWDPLHLETPHIKKNNLNTAHHTHHPSHHRSRILSSTPEILSDEMYGHIYVI